MRSAGHLNPEGAGRPVEGQIGSGKAASDRESFSAAGSGMYEEIVSGMDASASEHLAKTFQASDNEMVKLTQG